MSGQDLTRRSFTGSLGFALGASILAPRLASSAAQPAPPPPAAPTAPETSGAPATGAASAAAPRAGGPPPFPVRLDSNENPFGPAAAALDAMEKSRAQGHRYPDDLEGELTAVLARQHGVKPENIILGCGSGEILRMADFAFTGTGRGVVAADPTFEAVLMFAKVTRGEGVR